MPALKIKSAEQLIFHEAGIGDWFRGLGNKLRPQNPQNPQNQQPQAVQQSMQQEINALNQAISGFARVYNKQVQQVYNPAIQKIVQTVQELKGQRFTSFIPEVSQKINTLIQQLNKASAEESSDLQFMQEISNNAKILSDMLSNNANNKQPTSGGTNTAQEGAAAEAEAEANQAGQPGTEVPPNNTTIEDTSNQTTTENTSGQNTTTTSPKKGPYSWTRPASIKNKKIITASATSAFRLVA